MFLRRFGEVRTFWLRDYFLRFVLGFQQDVPCSNFFVGSELGDPFAILFFKHFIRQVVPIFASI